MNSNQAAIRRRAQPQPQQPVQTVQRQVQIAQQSPPIPPSLPTRVEPGQQLTLPQAVQILEFRVTNLEKSMKESTAAIASSQAESIPENVNEDILQVIDEYDERFNILASELKEVKDLLLSLQKYTMEVNKILYEERVRLLSDIDREATASEQD